MRVWRLTSRRHAETAFSGIGNQKVGSRWVPAGLPAVYTSEHAATAVLEILVHMGPEHFRERHVLITAEIPDDVRIETLDIKSLPTDWRRRYEDADLQAHGEAWIARAASAFLIVPSAVIPEERNVIINPLHPDFTRMVVHSPPGFPFR